MQIVEPTSEYFPEEHYPQFVSDVEPTSTKIFPEDKRCRLASSGFHR
jgi:hypothetical protein